MKKKIKEKKGERREGGEEKINSMTRPQPKQEKRGREKMFIFLRHLFCQQMKILFYLFPLSSSSKILHLFLLVKLERGRGREKTGKFMSTLDKKMKGERAQV